jgi:hypothetical protein
VALEGLVDDRTLGELEAKYEEHPNMITAWQRQVKRTALVEPKLVRVTPSSTTMSAGPNPAHKIHSYL